MTTFSTQDSLLDMTDLYILKACKTEQTLSQIDNTLYAITGRSRCFSALHRRMQTLSDRGLISIQEGEIYIYFTVTLKGLEELGKHPDL